jgi:hypothetical protein
MAIAATTTQRKPFVLFPLKHCSKEPACRFKSKDKFYIPDDCENRGIRLDRLLVLDIDVGRLPKGVTLEGAVETIRGMGVPVDECPRVRTGSGGEHIYLAFPDDNPRLAARLLPYIDVKAGRGAYVVAPGSLHPNGEQYVRLNRVKLRDAPSAPSKLMRMLVRPAVEPGGTSPGLLNAERLEICLQGLDVTEYRDHDRWLEIMMACRHACPEGETEFVSWSIGDPLYSNVDHEIAGRWRSLDPEVDGGITIATLYKHLAEARKARPDDPGPRRALAVMDFAGLEDDEPESEREAELPRHSLSIGELLALPQPEWLLEGALPLGSLGVLYGPPKSAKTFLALDLALSVATGRKEMHGIKLRRGRVLYVLAEGGAPMMGERAKAWLNSREIADADIRVLPRAINLANADAVSDLIATEGSDWDLVVFDTLARCMNGDENSVKDMSSAINGCDFIRQETGGAVLLVHHAGKDQSKGMRGSTALLGAVDSVMRMRQSAGGSYRFEVTELRHGEPGTTRELRLKGSGGSAVLVTDLNAHADFAPEATLVELASHVDDCTPRAQFKQAAAEELGRSVKTANDLITRHIPNSIERAAKSNSGRLVWREADPSSPSPRAELIRNAEPG